MGQKPRYILIVGDPAQVPFLFQAILSTTASVGRVDFDSLQDLQIYTEKIIRLETAVSPAVEREAIFFAPDYGTSDPTYYSRHYMVEPLADDIQNRIAVKTRLIAGRDATKERLQETLRRAKPALVYSASHGLGAPDESFETQKRVNGAICCQRSGRESSIKDWLFMADDVPHDVPFLEGAVVFQFACFGYGTPAESDFAHWDPRIQKVNASADFIAALPKALLAHPHGPVNFIGHVDVALLHGFDDPENPVPALGERWHPRIEPFRNAVDQLLNAQPSGQAMADMSGRYNIHNAQLTGVLDRIQRKKQQQTPDLQVRLASAFMSRSDAQNYMIFGDPAVHLRIPTE